MNIDAYLDRIGLSGPLPPTLDTLTKVHRAHLRAIPYENLDVQLGRPVTIERPPIFDKIVTRRRGGWCYEMNGLLGWGLGELGFRVTRATGAVMRETFGEPTEGNHLVLRVELDEGLYLADVGFGDGPLEPIRIAEGGFSSNGLPFSVSRVDENWWRLRNHPWGGAPSFDFNLAPADESRLAARCHELQTAPDSHFVLNLFCFRFRENGVVGVRGRVVRTVTADGCEDRILNSADELVRFFDEELNLRDPELGSLWPKICARHQAVMAEHGEGISPPEDPPRQPSSEP
ncbi:MAG TPA: arylamine N-acetyltransferase [Rhizomicrobium sp.]|jgi:N-hydroxyarylamine O-acetyltransferase|nr:arylamine N-acetyltransferase [Rhizomicrobium sp.]